MRVPNREIAVGEHRNSPEWVEREESGLAVLALGQIDRDDLTFEPKLQ